MSNDQTSYIQQLEEENARLKAEIVERSKSAEALETLFIHSVSAVAILDRDYHFIRVNDLFAQKDWRRTDDYPGHNFFHFYPDTHLEAVFDQVIRSGEKYKLSAVPYTDLAHPGQGTVYWDLTITPVLDAAGAVASLILAAVSVTEHIRDREKLAEREEGYRAIFDNSLVGILLALPDGAILSANPAACRIFGGSAGEICAVDRKSLVDYADARVMTAQREREKTGSIHAEITMVRLDGTRFPGEVSSNFFIDSHGRILDTLVVRDVTELRRYQLEVVRLDRLNQIGEMAAGIAHEIRNPMTTVRGFLQIFESTDGYLANKQYIELMIGELDRANAIISGFLSLAKNKPIDLKPLDLNEIILNLMPLLHAQAAKNDVSIGLELGNIPDLVMDRNEIRQMLLNLVLNGIDAMPAGGSITIRTQREGEGVILAVQDQGSGIPEEALSKLYTPFFTTKENGTGLGLPVCYSIAQRHKARMAVETSSAGTVFQVIFPQEK